MARENAVFEVKIDAAANTVAFKVVGNGNIHILHMDKVHPANVAYAALHGMKQRCVDNSALNRADKDGKVRPLAEQARLREEALVAMIEHYESGGERWNLREPGKGGARKPSIDLWDVIAAVQTVSGKPRETVLAMFDRRAAAASTTRQAIAESMAREARIAAELARMAAARADTSLTEGWEAELGDDTPEDTDTPEPEPVDEDESAE